MIGNKVGRLTVIEESQTRTPDRRIQYVCLCDCGNTTIIPKRHIGTKTNSCGCLQKEHISSLNRKSSEFKYSEHPLYSRWLGMKQRCYNPNHHKYKDYGSRGITVCNEWLNSFEDFIKDMGECPDGYTLDRINNDKDYCKENCKWSSPTEQANNRRERNSGKMYRKITP